MKVGGKKTHNKDKYCENVNCGTVFILAYSNKNKIDSAEVVKLHQMRLENFCLKASMRKYIVSTSSSFVTCNI